MELNHDAITDAVIKHFPDFTFFKKYTADEIPPDTSPLEGATNYLFINIHDDTVHMHVLVNDGCLLMHILVGKGMIAPMPIPYVLSLDIYNIILTQTEENAIQRANI